MGMDLEELMKLPRDEKLRLIEMIDEKERREKTRGQVYKPNAGQLPVHQCKKRIRVVFSGNGAGKTSLGMLEALWAARGYNPILKEYTPTPAKVVIVLDKPEKVDEVFFDPEEGFAKWTDTNEFEPKKNGKPYFNELLFKNGSSVSFMFHDQKAMAFESIQCDFVIFDEPPPRHVFVGLRRAGRKKNRQSRYLFLGTPITGSWMRTDLLEPWAEGKRDDIECFKFGTRVNEANLEKGYIENFSKDLTEKERRVRLEGEFFDIDGLALAHLVRHDTHFIHSDDVPEIVSHVVAIDPHPNKNHVACLIGIDRDDYLYYLKEYSSKEVPRQFARSLRNWYQGTRLFDIVCDSAGNTPMSGGDGNKSFIQVLQEEGIRVRGTTFDEKNDEDFVLAIQDALALPDKPNNFGQSIPRLRFVVGNEGIKRDVETVSWQKVRNEDAYKPTLDIQKKDFLACLKYALATNLSSKKIKAKAYRRIKKVKAYGQR